MTTTAPIAFHNGFNGKTMAVPCDPLSLDAALRAQADGVDRWGWKHAPITQAQANALGAQTTAIHGGFTHVVRLPSRLWLFSVKADAAPSAPGGS